MSRLAHFVSVAPQPFVTHGLCVLLSEATDLRGLPPIVSKFLSLSLFFSLSRLNCALVFCFSQGQTHLTHTQHHPTNSPSTTLPLAVHHQGTAQSSPAVVAAATASSASSMFAQAGSGANSSTNHNNNNNNGHSFYSGTAHSSTGAIQMHQPGQMTSKPFPRTGSYIFSDCGSGKVFSDAASMRSIASIGMGSTDGKKMVIRRVPTSPTELLTIINQPG